MCSTVSAYLHVLEPLLQSIAYLQQLLLTLRELLYAHRIPCIARVNEHDTSIRVQR